ncbi:MAG: hypothetical protein JXL84_20505 [Deltaproteobacteria bacterium]|nr:hypothetical protein [Deltaproteobacteria bacterium]
MALKTTLEQLEEVQSAISAVMTSQEYTRGNRSLVRAKLADLEAREKSLLERYNAEQGTGGTPRINVAIPKRDY